MSMLDAALALAGQGCLVFPLRRSTKEPHIRRWQHLATNRERAIRNWWRKWPNANPGIHTRGLIVLDVDGPVGHRCLKALRAEYACPDTVTAISGNVKEPHHYHLFYRLPPGLRGWNKHLDEFAGFEAYDRIDVKSGRGQVVGPGARHESGGTYRWKVEPNDIYADAAQAPDWMVERLCRPDAQCNIAATPEMGSDEELLNVLTARFPIPGPGTRNETMTRAVGWLAGKGFAAERILSLMDGWLRAFASRYNTDETQAHRELVRCVYPTVSNREAGTFEVYQDHQAAAAKQDLARPAEKWLQELFQGNITSNLRRKSARAAGRREGHAPGQGANRPSIPNTDRAHNQSTNHGVCSGVCSDVPIPRIMAPEWNFLRALLLHVQYERATKGQSLEVLMTDRQLLAIYCQITGKSLCWDSFYRLKAKFIARPDDQGVVRPARHVELLVLRSKGDFGKPSRYELTGLRAAFSGREGLAESVQAGGNEAFVTLDDASKSPTLDGYPWWEDEPWLGPMAQPPEDVAWEELGDEFAHLHPDNLAGGYG